MATTLFATPNTLVRKKWSQKAFEYALANMWLSKFMGKGADSIIQVNKELGKGKGDKITFKLRAPLDGFGQGDNGTIEGNEQALVYHSFPLEVHEVGTGVRAAGKLSDFRQPDDFRSEAKDALGIWQGEFLEQCLINALCGLGNVPFVGQIDGTRDTNITVVNEIAPSSGRIWRGGGKIDGTGFEKVASDALLDANNLFTTQVISTVKRKAQMAINTSTGARVPKIRPVKVDGKNYYVMFISPFQAKSLKMETAWLAAQRDANIRGNSNPIFSGALGVWDGVVIHEFDRIPIRTGAGTTGLDEGFATTNGTATSDALANGVSAARALFLGAQAAGVAWGQLFNWHEKDFDYDRIPGVATDAILGISKTQFKLASDGTTAQEDFGVIAVDTAVVLD